MENNPTTQQTPNNKKMTVCKTCGAPMAKSAKECPSCGAKNGKKKLIKLIVFLVIIAIVVGYPAFHIIKNNNSATITARNGEEFKIAELSDVYEDYMANDKYKEFVNTYLPAEVVIEGEITKIDDTTTGVSSDGYTAHLESGASRIIKFQINNNPVYTIRYDLYSKAEDYEFGKLKVGDKIIAKGYITDSVTKNGKYLNDALPYDYEIIGSADGIEIK